MTLTPSVLYFKGLLLGGAEGGALFISLPKAQKTLLAALYSHNRDAKEYLKCIRLQVI